MWLNPLLWNSHWMILAEKANEPEWDHIQRWFCDGLKPLACFLYAVKRLGSSGARLRRSATWMWPHVKPPFWVNLSHNRFTVLLLPRLFEDAWSMALLVRHCETRLNFLPFLSHICSLSGNYTNSASCVLSSPIFSCLHSPVFLCPSSIDSNAPRARLPTCSSCLWVFWAVPRALCRGLILLSRTSCPLLWATS